MSVLELERLNGLSTKQLLALVDKLGSSIGVTASNGSTASRKALVAYYIPQNLDPALRAMECHIVNAIDETELKEYCANRLTAQQSPARFIALNKFPNLPNGKLALSKLPLPTQATRATDNEQEGESESAMQLASILGEILGMSDVRTSDNFFEIGGDSITAIQFISRARDAGIQIEVAAISQSSTIAVMANTSKTISETVGTIEADGKTQNDRFAASGLDNGELNDFLQSFD